MEFQKLGLVSDHAGKDLRAMALDYLQTAEIELLDLGVPLDHPDSVDYPDYGALLGQQISEENIDGGIAICGTGIGMALTINKFPKTRANSAWDEYSCRLSRQHNNSNVLCLGARTLNHLRAIDLIKIWLETPFLGDRHQIRLDKIVAIEKKNFNQR